MDPTRVDNTTVDELTGKLVLLIEEGPSPRDVGRMQRELSAKIRGYVRYMRSDEFIREHGVHPRQAIVRFVSAAPPTEESLDFLERVSYELSKHGVTFERQVGEDGIPVTVEPRAPSEPPLRGGRPGRRMMETGWSPPSRAPRAEDSEKESVAEADPSVAGRDSVTDIGADAGIFGPDLEAETLGPEETDVSARDALSRLSHDRDSRQETPAAALEDEMSESEAEVLESAADYLPPKEPGSADAGVATADAASDSGGDQEVPRERDSAARGVEGEPETIEADRAAGRDAASDEDFSDLIAEPSELERLIEADSEIESQIEADSDPGFLDPSEIETEPESSELAGVTSRPKPRPSPFFPEEEFGRAVPDDDERAGWGSSTSEPVFLETKTGKQMRMETPGEMRAMATARAAAETRPSLLRATSGAAFAGLAGAVTWALLAVPAANAASPLALVVGVMVGISTRLQGNGATMAFRAVGALVTLIGSLLGSVLTTVTLTMAGVGYEGDLPPDHPVGIDGAISLLTNPARLLDALTQYYGPLHVVLVALAVYIAFRMSASAGSEGSP